MSYGRRSYGRARRPMGDGKWMELRRPGTCTAGHPIPAGTRAYWDPRDQSVTCTDLEHAEAAGLTREEWAGSPVSGGYVKRLAERRTLRDSDGTVLAMTSRGLRRGYEHTGSRCEDAPCCGCCD